MKIDMGNVFIGTINKCVKYEMHTTFSLDTSIGDISFGSESFGYIIRECFPYKKNAILLKVVEDGYVDLDTLNNFLDEIKVKSKITKDGGFYLDGLILSNNPHKKDSLFVDESSLVKYEPLQNTKQTTVKQLKKTLLMDSRIPGGIEH